MSVKLKIKAMSLAAEAKIIRREELKEKARQALFRSNGSPVSMDLYVDLHNHRVHDVRKAARSTHLARAFIKGTPYRAVEWDCNEPPSKQHVLKLLESYGPPEFRNQPVASRIHALTEWFNAPHATLEGAS